MKERLLAAAIAMGGFTVTSAQQLELSTGGGPVGAGPVEIPGASTFRLNSVGTSTFSAFAPVTTVQVAFSNQQYVNDAFPGMTAGGTSTGGTSGAPGATSIYQAMNSLGSPANAEYTSGPFIIAGTGFSVSDNYGYRLYSDVSYLQGQSLNSRYYYGDLTLSFSRPVLNPVVHFAGIGAQTSTGVAGTNNLGYYTEFDLSSSNISAGYTLTKLSGTTYFNVTGTSILNSSTAPSTVQPNSYYTSQSTGNSASGGSVRINTGGTPITSVTFRVYVRGDGGVGTGNVWMSTTRAGDGYQLSATLGTYSLSGNVFNDVNGLSDNTINGVATNLPTLHANLIDGTGQLYATVPVTNGAYTFSNVVGGNYTVLITTTSGATTPSLPSGWTTVGEKLGTGTGTDGTSNGIETVAVGVSSSVTNVTNANFSIQQLPTAGGGVINNVINPAVAMQHTVPASAFSNTSASTDPAPGAVTSIRIIAFPTGAASIAVNGIPYTSANFPAGGVVVPANSSGQPTQTITVDPAAIGLTTVSIPFKAVDASGAVSTNTGAAVVNFIDLTVQGTVRNDPTGGTITGQGIGIAGTTQLYVNLVNAATGLVTATDTLDALGTYSFGFHDGLETNMTYNLVLSTTKGIVGTVTGSAASLPSGWVNTADGDQATSGDGTPNGFHSVPIAVSSVSGKDFAIERGPNTDNKASTINTPTIGQFITLDGGTGNPPAMTGSDPDDQPTSATLSGKKIAITSLPSNGKVWYNGTQVTVGQNGTTSPSVSNPLIISNLNLALLQFQATGVNYTNTSFTYAYIDEAGVMDGSPATYSVGWSTPLNMVLSSFNALAHDCNAVLRWESSSEEGLVSYEVQHSTTGKEDFLTVASVSPHGSGGHYELLHAQPSTRGYYRLKLNTRSGNAEYSATKLVASQCDVAKDVSLFPNPTSGLVHIQGLQQSTQLRVYDLQGRIVSSKLVDGATVLDLSQLAPGAYHIVITEPGNSIPRQLKIVKQ